MLVFLNEKEESQVLCSYSIIFLMFGLLGRSSCKPLWDFREFKVWCVLTTLLFVIVEFLSTHLSFRKLDSPQPVKLLMASSDDSNKRLKGALVSSILIYSPMVNSICQYFSV